MARHIAGLLMFPMPIRTVCVKIGFIQAAGPVFSETAIIAGPVMCDKT